MQVIVYKEYLPITLGDNGMHVYRLHLSRGSTSYDSTIDPTLYNEFATAAYRFGHTLINSWIAGRPLNSTYGINLLRDDFFHPFELYWGVISPLMVGLTNSPAQSFDRHLVPDVTNFLYRTRGEPAGLDLASINIQRGRDHGIPTYRDMVLHCSKKTITSFKDIIHLKIMSEENANLLSQNYRNFNDIDLWTGILSENRNRGAIVGPTATCIIGKQFENLKFGDRFYFEHGGQPNSFAKKQVEELKKMTLSALICLNTEADALPHNAMMFKGNNNNLVNCKLFKGIDLSYWRHLSSN